MRLLFIVESGTDVRLVDGLARRFELQVLCREIVGGVPISWDPRPEISVVHGPSSRIGFAVRIARELSPGVAAPDAILVQGYAAAALVANLAGRMRRIPTVMLVCSPVEAYYRCRALAGDPSKPFRRPELLGVQGLARLNARAGLHYVVLSEYLERVVRSHGWQGPVDRIPLYGVDVTRYVPSSRPREELRTELGLPANGKLLLFSSRVAPEKDARTALLALARLRRRPERVWLVNRGGGFDAFARLAESVGVRDRVVGGGPLHPQRNLPLLYQAADVCVQASREEGLGFSPLEALACGTPVVATAVGGLTETIVPEETGWTYPPGNADALANSIVEAFDQPVEAARRTAVGRRMVVERFAEEKVLDDFERLVRMLVARSRPPGAAPEAGADSRRSEPNA